MCNEGIENIETSGKEMGCHLSLMYIQNNGK